MSYAQIGQNLKGWSSCSNKDFKDWFWKGTEREWPKGRYGASGQSCNFSLLFFLKTIVTLADVLLI